MANVKGFRSECKSPIYFICANYIIADRMKKLRVVYAIRIAYLLGAGIETFILFQTVDNDYYG